MLPESLRRLATLTAAVLVISAVLMGCDSRPRSTSGKSTDFTLKDTHNNEVSLSDFRGKVVMLEFWATTCPTCVKSIPEFAEMAKRLKPRGFEVIAISMDFSVSDVQNFMKTTEMPFTVLMSTPRVEKQYGVISIPTTFLIDKNGVVVKRHLGYAEGIGKEIEKDVLLLLEDMPVKSKRKASK